MKLQIFSFFSGVGFLDLGLEDAGFEIALVNEIERFFMEGYRQGREKLRRTEPQHGYFERDALDFLDGNLSLDFKSWFDQSRKQSDGVGIVGGPPCPDFSIGGKNKGSQGKNGKLSGAYIELICQTQPDFFVFENVKGLWKTKKHRAFYESLKRKLYKHGYLITEKLINTLEYGVPQYRERVILIGFHARFLTKLNIDIPIQYPQEIPEYLFPWREVMLYDSDKILTLPWIQSTPFQEDSEFPCPDNIPLELTVEHWFSKNQVYHHFNASHHFKPRAGIEKMKKVDEGDDSKKSYKRLHRWRYSPTACYGNNEVHLHPYKIRRLSAAEALAIQSLPKDFILPDSLPLSYMFKAIGNGVPYLAAKAIGRALIKFLSSTELQAYDSSAHEEEQLNLPLVFSGRGKYKV